MVSYIHKKRTEKVKFQNLLTNGSGHPIRGQNGLITIPPNVELEVTEDGSIFFARDPMGDPEAEAVFVDKFFYVMQVQRELCEERILY